ncbi:hypothetical protein P7C71_g5256, partial [Lecanoromycetidae sp. Uapishka_2]
MDEFAQTRGADDLFDDDFTPIAESATQKFDPQAEDFNPKVQTFDLQPQLSQRGGRNAPRGRGNRRSDTNSHPQQPILGAQPPSNPSVGDAPANQNAALQNETGSTNLPQQNPSQLRGPTAVRGDRTATGGTIKPKLTEDELSERLAAAKLNSAKRVEAHRLAEADEASFQQREEQASKKRQEEGQARRQMNQEREKNRLRKLGAQAGREWDEGKEEQAAKEDRGSQYQRGAHGGVAYEGGRGRRTSNGYQNGGFMPEYEEKRGGYISRGRGRGDRGRGGRGRAGYNPNIGTQQAAPDPVADFPALPTAARSEPKSDFHPASKVERPLSPATVGGNWADEVQATKIPNDG